LPLGINTREPPRPAVALVVSILLAALAAFWSLYKIGLVPPSLTPRAVEMGAASTEVVVDTPDSAILDLRQGTSNLESLNNRALLVGNVMASLPVRDYIGRRAHVAPDAIRVAPPLTPDFPRPLAQTGDAKHTTDLLRSADQYRLSIEANPTVPVLYIHAQAPSAKAAAELANGSVDGLRDYLAAVAASDRVAPTQQVQVRQLGRARGGVINDGAGLQFALVVFLGVFGASFGLLRFLDRRKHRAPGTEQREPDVAWEHRAPATEQREPEVAWEHRAPATEQREPEAAPVAQQAGLPAERPHDERAPVGTWLDFGSTDWVVDGHEPEVELGNGQRRSGDRAGEP
jgi:hypothetical protein